MGTIDWEERVFQLASSILVNHINDIYIETAIEVAQNFKEKYIEKMSLDEPKKEKKGKEKDESFEEAWLLYRRKGSKKIASEQWAKMSQKEKDTAIKHIVAYVGSRELQYQKDFERYLRDKCFNNVVYDKQFVVFDPNHSEENTTSKREEKLVIGGTVYR